MNEILKDIREQLIRIEKKQDSFIADIASTKSDITWLKSFTRVVISLTIAGVGGIITMAFKLIGNP